MKTKDAILEMLSEANGQYCSGEQLAAKLGVSRAAIWKAVEQLKADGCSIDAVTNRGYRLTEAPDLLDEVRLRESLQSTDFGQSLYVLQTVDSTNTYAKALAAQGAVHGTVIVSAQQTGGRGRMGKSFFSPKGGLYLSLILRPELQMQDMLAVTACTATAVCLALLDFGVQTEIKWVNDLFLHGRKICGILCEGGFSMEDGHLDYLVIGIGVNLHKEPNMPEELRNIITDITSETGIRITRTDLAAAIVRHLEEEFAGLPERKFLTAYRNYSCTIGQRVQVTLHGTEVICTAVGYTNNAELIVRLDDGTEAVINSGSATPAGEPPVVSRSPNGSAPPPKVEP